MSFGGPEGREASPASTANPAHTVVCDTDRENTLSQLRRKARYIAKRTFCGYNLNRLVLERDYMAERRAILERVSSGSTVHEGKGYGVSDPTAAKIPELEALRAKYRDYLWRNQVVEDVLGLLDADTAKLVRLCYMESKSVAWVTTHAEETGLYYAEDTIKKRLQVAKEMLARRMGEWPENEYTFDTLLADVNIGE